MEEKILAAIEFACGVFAGDCTGHDLAHTLRVYRMARELAEKEGADLGLVSLAALLHDVDDVKVSPETSEGLDRAVGFLRAAGETEERISAIRKIIHQVSFLGEDSVTPDTLEGKCVQDADRLDALGAVGIARAFAYGGAHHRAMYDPSIPPKEHMSREEYRSSRSTTVNHFYEKLLKLEGLMNTDTARRIAGQRTRYMREFLEEFFREWGE